MPCGITHVNDEKLSQLHLKSSESAQLFLPIKTHTDTALNLAPIPNIGVM